MEPDIGGQEKHYVFTPHSALKSSRNGA